MHLYAIQDIHFIVYNIWIYLIIFHDTSHHASCIMHHASCIMHHASCIMHHASCIMHVTFLIISEFIVGLFTSHEIHSLPFLLKALVLALPISSSTPSILQPKYCTLGTETETSETETESSGSRSPGPSWSLYICSPVWRCQLATGHLLLQLFFVSGHPFLQSLKTFVCGLSSEISSQASTTAKRREKALRPTSDNVCSSVWKRCSTASPWLENCSSSH